MESFPLGERAAVESMILCCECGTQIAPNPAAMCVACLRTRVDITEGIPKQAALYFCKSCERYLQPPSRWISAALESRELLAVCLKKIKGITKEVRLVDAGFIWTEPHSKRVKVKLTIQKEVLSGAVLQQTFVVEYVVTGQMCDDCHRVEAKDYWKCVVQIRQKADHRKTMYYLEQLILKHNAHANTTNIKQMHDGMDFYYAAKNEGRKLMDFLQQVVPCRYITAQELVSHDIHSNTYNYKDTFSVELVPVCKDNVVCLPARLAQKLGNMGQVCVVLRVTQLLHVIDPITCQLAEISAAVFWREPFSVLCGPKQLTEFCVMEIDHVTNPRHIACHAPVSNKHVLADVWVVRASELGTTEAFLSCRTHLGHLLSVGDSVLGFDLRCANTNDNNLDKMKAEQIPDVVLVKKVYGDSNKRQKKRKWKLQHLTEDTDRDKEYTDFLEDLEEDQTYRTHVNIYKDAAKLAVDADDSSSDDEDTAKLAVDADDSSSDDEGAPRISLAEMLDDLHIVEDATGGEGAPMQD